MELDYKKIAWTLAAGGAILGAAFALGYLWKPKKPKLNRQTLEEDVRKMGSVELADSLVIEKKQMAHIVALAQHHAASYDSQQRQRLCHERLADLATRNSKAYLQAAINTLNFEYECTQTLCEEIATLLELSLEDLAVSQDFYTLHEDLEFSDRVLAIAAELNQSQVLPKLVHDKAEQLLQEYQELSKELGSWPDLELSTDTKIKLHNPNAAECKRCLLELRVCDELSLRHQIAHEHIQQLVQSRNSKRSQVKTSAI